jgi:hypothetical protein
MANLTSALQQLRAERKQAQYRVEKLDSAISVLEDLVGRNGSLTRTAAGGSRVVTATDAQAHGCCSESTMGEGAHTNPDKWQRKIEPHSYSEANFISCGPPQDCGCAKS